MIHVSTREGDVGSLFLAKNEYGVRTGGRLSLPLAPHLEIVDGDAPLLWKDAPAVERNPHNAINAKGLGILPKNALQTGTTG